MTPEKKDTPWMDVHLTKEVMNYLWDIINNPIQPTTDAKGTLAGNISKSEFIKDKDNWFYEKVLKEMSEYLFYKNSWSSYFDVNIAKTKPPPIFTLKSLWVNYQKQHEFNPPHNHAGLYSFVVFMKIPTHWKEQYELPWLKGVNHPQASDFQFLFGHGDGRVEPTSPAGGQISLSPEDEGRMLFFPSWLAHQVFPFYGTEEERITISGNIIWN